MSLPQHEKRLQLDEIVMDTKSNHAIFITIFMKRVLESKSRVGRRQQVLLSRH